MYASLSLELFMHPLLILFTWLKTKKKLIDGQYDVIPRKTHMRCWNCFLHLHQQQMIEVNQTFWIPCSSQQS